MLRSLATAAFLGLVACAPDRAPATPAGPATRAEQAGVPEGTILLVDGIPARADEVTRIATWIGVLYPAYSRPHCRRLALTNYVLPRLAVLAAYPKACAQAQAACRATFGRAPFPDDGSWSGLEGEFERLNAGWQRIGLEAWGRARELAPGTWSEPFARVDGWAFVRLDGLDSPSSSVPETISVSLVTFPYRVPSPLTRDLVEAAIDRAQLSILDEAWADVVPEAWKYRMQAATASDRERPERPYRE